MQVGQLTRQTKFVLRRRFLRSKTTRRLPSRDCRKLRFFGRNPQRRSSTQVQTASCLMRSRCSFRTSCPPTCVSRMQLPSFDLRVTDAKCLLQVLNVVNGAKEVAASRNEQLTCDSLAAVFDSLGYSVYVRNALGGGPGMECMENLSHRFLVVEVPNAENTTESLIVDIDFRAQFELAQPTLLYQELMNNMDAEFIGSERFLRDAVQVLCDEMALAFKDQGQHPPPWRRMSSMLSKWCPRRSEDIAPSSRAVPEDMLKDMEKKGIVGVSTQKLRQSSLPSEGSSGASKRQAFRSPWKTSGRIAPAPHGLPWMQDGEADVIPSKA